MAKRAIFLAACTAISAWLRVRSMRAGAPGPATPQEELTRELGGGLALLVVTLAGLAAFDRPVSSPVLVAVSVTGLLIVFVLPLARRLLPFALTGIGLTGIGLVLTEACGQFGGSDGGAGWWRAVLLLLACGFLAAAWLSWPARHRLSRLARSAIESACYFAVAEVLANAVKHADARAVQIRIRHETDRPASRASSRLPRSPGTLRMTVTDDGIGGADPARGSGLAGIERRLGTFDGIVAVSSPPGGPTMIVMEVPCALSSPRTFSC